MISNERVRRKYPVQNITIIQYRSPVVRSAYELCGSGSVSVARHAGHRIGRCFQGSAAISSALCSSALWQDCCVRSDLAAFTSADAFSGRSEGTIRVSGNMRANNSEMLREVAIAGWPYLDAQLARRALISRQVAFVLSSPIGRPPGQHRHCHPRGLFAKSKVLEEGSRFHKFSRRTFPLATLLGQGCDAL
jgi:hypothetical protein